MTGLDNDTVRSEGRFEGLSVLVVEDETLVSLLIESMLSDLGCDDVWYASDVSQALELLAENTPDAAVLDVNLAGEQVYPVAFRLAAAAVPFVFATGYGASGIDQEWASRPVIQKPFQREKLAAALATALGAAIPEDTDCSPVRLSH
jgi:CheY-like chemotaxis protein